MEVKMGYTAITCKACSAISAVDNRDLEKMVEFHCPSCNTRMTDYEFAHMKMHYYLLMAQMYHAHWGSVRQYERFNYDIRIQPHLEVQEMKENDNPEGGVGHG